MHNKNVASEKVTWKRREPRKEGGVLILRSRRGGGRNTASPQISYAGNIHTFASSAKALLNTTKSRQSSTPFWACQGFHIFNGVKGQVLSNLQFQCPKPVSESPWESSWGKNALLHIQQLCCQSFCQSCLGWSTGDLWSFWSSTLSSLSSLRARILFTSKSQWTSLSLLDFYQRVCCTLLSQKTARSQGPRHSRSIQPNSVGITYFKGTKKYILIRCEEDEAWLVSPIWRPQL